MESKTLFLCVVALSFSYVLSEAIDCFVCQDTGEKGDCWLAQAKTVDTHPRPCPSGWCLTSTQVETASKTGKKPVFTTRGCVDDTDGVKEGCVNEVNEFNITTCFCKESLCNSKETINEM